MYKIKFTDSYVVSWRSSNPKNKSNRSQYVLQVALRPKIIVTILSLLNFKELLVYIKKYLFGFFRFFRINSFPD
jgi:hypothetical protein